jgi:hypothetical protein
LQSYLEIGAHADGALFDAKSVREYHQRAETASGILWRALRANAHEALHLESGISSMVDKCRNIAEYCPTLVRFLREVRLDKYFRPRGTLGNGIDQRNAIDALPHVDYWCQRADLVSL